MDANFSLKRMAFGNKIDGDTRQFLESDYYLRDEEIEKYANEVKRQTKGPRVPQEDDMPLTSDEIDDAYGDPTDSADSDQQIGASGCATRWKAASDDTKKSMWGVFMESGNFLSACRHGLILWAADLVRCGELYVAFTCLCHRALIYFTSGQNSHLL